MARTSLSYTNLVANSAATATPTTIDQANGMTILASQPERTILVVSNTDTSPHNVTVQNGDPTLGAGTYPALVVSVPASSTRYLGPFESVRYVQRDGSVWVDFAAGFTGTIVALYIPRGVL